MGRVEHGRYGLAARGPARCGQHHQRAVLGVGRQEGRPLLLVRVVDPRSGHHAPERGAEGDFPLEAGCRPLEGGQVRRERGGQLPEGHPSAQQLHRLLPYTIVPARAAQRLVDGLHRLHGFRPRQPLQQHRDSDGCPRRVRQPHLGQGLALQLGEQQPQERHGEHDPLERALLRNGQPLSDYRHLQGAPVQDLERLQPALLARLFLCQQGCPEGWHAQ